VGRLGCKRSGIYTKQYEIGVSTFGTNSKRVNEYFEAVSGLLSGRFRILEHWRGRRPVKARLQAPSQGRWKTVAGWSVLLSIPWPRKSVRIVQNLHAIEPVRELNHHPAKLLQVFELGPPSKIALNNKIRASLLD
jgi:hypothetical protein